jgi:hypothetical protein
VDEINDLEPGRLGAAQLHLQVRGEAYNAEAYNLFDPTLILGYEGDEGPGEPLSPYDTLSLDDSAAETNGRVLTINNLSGRIIIRDFEPIRLDELHLLATPIEYF